MEMLTGIMCPFSPEEEKSIRKNWLYGDYDGSDGVERNELMEEQLQKQSVLANWMEDVQRLWEKSPEGQAFYLNEIVGIDIQRDVKSGECSIRAGIQALDQMAEKYSDGLTACHEDCQYFTGVRAKLVAILSEYAA